MPGNSQIHNPVADFRASQRKNVSRWQGLAFPDIWLLVAWMALIVIGMVMVTSSSLAEASAGELNAHYFAMRQAIFYGGASLAAYVVFTLDTRLYQQKAGVLLLLMLLMLLAVYIPGVGASVNSARRWINLRVFNLQVGELFKVAIIIFTAAYLQKNSHKLDHSWQPIFVLFAVLAVFSGLLLKQPDFGTTMVVVATVLGMMFVSGVSLWRLIVIGLVALGAMSVILVSESYRVKRLLTFMNPWDHQFDEGYQLVNSLIAVGRGHIYGVGLGESIQKHQFLPEAHTDFIFAIISEETGLIGSLLVMAVFTLLVWRAFVIGQLADRVRKRFASNLAYGIGLWIAIQTLINIGVTTGALPTKGLTLPLISYGGSSVLSVSIALAILARIDAEARFQARREGVL